MGENVYGCVMMIVFFMAGIKAPTSLDVRQRKMQYRMELERQIEQVKLRKVEERKKDKDNGYHPLGPRYALAGMVHIQPTATHLTQQVQKDLNNKNKESLCEFLK